MKYITNRKSDEDIRRENICSVMIKGFHQEYTKNFYKPIRKDTQYNNNWQKKETVNS